MPSDTPPAAAQSEKFDPTPLIEAAKAFKDFATLEQMHRAYAFLRKEVDAETILAWGEQHAADLARIAALEAENARLREAIEYVLDGFGLNAPDYAPEEECGPPSGDLWIIEKLRAALGARHE